MVGLCYDAAMSDLHHVGVASVSGKSLESVHPEFIRQGLVDAQRKSWDGFQEIRRSLKAGMTENEARELATRLFTAMGSPRHWHRPYVRFGPGTALTFHESLQKEYRLQEGDAVYLDLGPVWRGSESDLEYEGDVGDSFAFGANAEYEQCAQAARDLWAEGRRMWRDEGASGEKIYAWMRERAPDLGWTLVEKVTGHRVSDFPHTKYSKERLSKVPFHPATSLWILELQLNHPDGKFGAFYEDLLQ